MIKDFKVTLKIYNNQIKERREELDMSQVQLGKSCGVQSTDISALENMRLSPRLKNEEWRESALAIAAFFCVPVEDMFPPMTEELAGAKSSFVTISSEEIEQRFAEYQRCLLGEPERPDDAYERAENQHRLKTTINSTLSELTYREELVIRHRFGIDKKPKTLYEVSNIVNTGKEHVRQIEARALNRLRQSALRKHIRELS